MKPQALGRAAACLVLLGWSLAASAPLPGPRPAPTTAVLDPFALSAEKYTLPSGMTVLLRPDPLASRVVVSLWFDVGSRHETPGRTGFAHLFEHLMFMGTRNVAGNRFDTLMEVEGGGNNATTSADRTHYFDYGPRQLLPTLLWLEADRLTHLPESMTDEKVALQREVVRNERRQVYENRPYGAAELLIPSAMYPAGHPYSWPVIGSHADLVAASTDDVKQFFYKHYTPGNATLAVVGDFDPDEARRLIGHYFGWMPKRPKPAVNSIGEQVSEMVVPVVQSLTVKDRVALPRLYVLWHAPAFGSAKFSDAVLLADLLGKGKSSRLYRALVVEQKVAQAVETEVDPQQLGSLLSVVVTGQPGVSHEQLTAAVDKELSGFAAEIPSVRDINRARNLRLTDLARDIETPLGQARWLLQLSAQRGNQNGLLALVEQLRKATPESLRGLCADLGIGQRSRRLQIQVLPRPASEPVEAVVEKASAKPFYPTGHSPKIAHLAMRPTVDLTKQPKPALARPQAAPPSGRFWVNGIEVTLVQKKGTPLVETVVAVSAGEADAGDGKSGLSEAVAAMLSEGSAQRSGVDWAQAMETAGASWKVQVFSDTTFVSMGVLAQNYADAAPLFYDALLRPTFSPQDFARVQAERLAVLEQKKAEPAAIAELVLRKSLFGPNHPYGRSPLGTAGSLKKLSASDLRAFHGFYYSPKHWKVAIAGDFEPSQAVASRLGAWMSAPKSVPQRPKGAAMASFGGLWLVQKPGAPQAEIRVANVVPGALDPERPAMEVANALLGGMFTSRLNLNLREKRGYTYGARSQIVRMDGIGLWSAAAAVRADVVVESVAEILKEMDRLHTEPCLPEELTRGRNAALSRLVAHSERGATLAQFFASSARNRLPPDEFARLLVQLQGVNATKLQQVTAARLQTQNATIVVVGDAEKLRPLLSLRWAGGVHYADVEGNPLAAPHQAK